MSDVFWSRHSYGKIVDGTVSHITVKNEAGKIWTVDRSIFDAEFKLSVPQTNKAPAEVSRTEMIELITTNQRQIMVVTFRKKIKEAEVVKAMRALVAEEIRPNSREFGRRVKEAIAGNARTMIGRHEGAYDDHGRLFFVDMENKGLRVIDLRTVEKLIVDGREYTVK